MERKPRPGYSCLQKVMYRLTRDRISDKSPCLPVHRSCNDVHCIANSNLEQSNVMDDVWFLYRHDIDSLFLRPWIDLQEALIMLTKGYLGIKGSVLFNHELYDLLNALSVLCGQSYNRGDRETLYNAVKKVCKHLSGVIEICQCDTRETESYCF